MTDDAMTVVRRALEAFNAGDAERFLAHVADDVRFWMNGSHLFSGPADGKPAFLELVGRVNAGLSEPIRLDVLNAIAAGEWAVIEAQGSAVTASGEPYRNRYCMLWRVRGGKIVELKEYNDSALVERSFPG
jgi:ketosteroid isomerase-like protein